MSAPTADSWRALVTRRNELSEATQRALARHWTTTAQLEHASVASFSRFSLQLLAIGAPAPLLVATHRAALDELAHAELCFSLASVYAGESIGPGRLPMNEQVLGPCDVQSVAVATVEEGCVGETIAALEAETARELARDDAVKSVLSRIHEDESRHAELAFGFVGWAVEAGGADVRLGVRAAFERTLTLYRGARPSGGLADTELELHGVLGAERKRALRDRVLTEVVEPAVRRLCG